MSSDSESTDTEPEKKEESDSDDDDDSSDDDESTSSDEEKTSDDSDDDSSSDESDEDRKPPPPPPPPPRVDMVENDTQTEPENDYGSMKVRPECKDVSCGSEIVTTFNTQESQTDKGTNNQESQTDNVEISYVPKDKESESEQPERESEELQQRQTALIFTPSQPDLKNLKDMESMTDVQLGPHDNVPFPRPDQKDSATGTEASVYTSSKEVQTDDISFQSPNDTSEDSRSQMISSEIDHVPSSVKKEEYPLLTNVPLRAVPVNIPGQDQGVQADIPLNLKSRSVRTQTKVKRYDVQTFTSGLIERVNMQTYTSGLISQSDNSTNTEHDSMKMKNTVDMKMKNKKTQTKERYIAEATNEKQGDYIAGKTNEKQGNISGTTNEKQGNIPRTTNEKQGNIPRTTNAIKQENETFVNTSMKPGTVPKLNLSDVSSESSFFVPVSKYKQMERKADKSMKKEPRQLRGKSRNRRSRPTSEENYGGKEVEKKRSKTPKQDLRGEDEKEDESKHESSRVLEEDIESGETKKTDKERANFRRRRRRERAVYFLAIRIPPSDFRPKSSNQTRPRTRPKSSGLLPKRKSVEQRDGRPLSCAQYRMLYHHKWADIPF
jgi:hypothetical protein